MDVISTARLMILISHRAVFTDALSNRGLNNAMEIHHHSLLSCAFFICHKNYLNNTIENYSGNFSTAGSLIEYIYRTHMACVKYHTYLLVILQYIILSNYLYWIYSFQNNLYDLFSLSSTSIIKLIKLLILLQSRVYLFLCITA